MTPNQIVTPAKNSPNPLPGLVKEKTGPQSKPIQPKNIRSLYVEKDDVKNVIVAALKGAIEVPPCRRNVGAGPKPRAQFINSAARRAPPVGHVPGLTGR